MYQELIGAKDITYFISFNSHNESVRFPSEETEPHRDYITYLKLFNYIIGTTEFELAFVSLASKFLTIVLYCLS